MISSLMARRAAAVVGGAVLIVSLAAVGAAQAETSGSSPSAAGQFAAEATSYQNAAIAKAMASAPGGNRVSPSEVIWHNGAMILRVALTANASVEADGAAVPDNPGGCPNSYFCIWTGANYSGTR